METGVMTKASGRNKGKKKLTAGGVFWLGTLIPAVALLVMYIHLEIWPFGDQSLLHNDFIHQYLPFLTEMRRHLVNKTSLFYSFSGGLGYNFWTTIAYYTASPLNLLTVLIPEAFVSTFMIWMAVAKVAVSGGILAWYLYQREKEGAIAAVALGTLYALSNYFLGYKNNTMWLDSIAVAPLVLFGIERLVEQRRSGVYIASLFYGIWCNYYIGYMLCLFSCLYFALEVYLRKEVVGGIPRCVCRFAVSSLAAGGSAAVLLVPTVISIYLTPSAGGGTSIAPSFFSSAVDLVRAHYADAMAFRISYERGDVLIYCGTAVLLLAALYFVNASVDRRERIGMGLLTGFLLVSFSFAPLNYVWHGFHMETGLPNRFAFLYLIVLLRICHTSLCRIRGVKRRPFLIAAGIPLLVTVGMTISGVISQDGTGMLISLLLMMVYVCLLYMLCFQQRRTSMFLLILCAIMTLESAGHAWINLTELGTTIHSFYVSYQKDVQELLQEEGTDGFYRMDVDSGHSLNFNAYAGTKGLTYFSSNMNPSVLNLFRDFGVYTRLNTIWNKGFTKPVRDIFGQRYMITSQVKGNTWNGMIRRSEKNGRVLYENPDALSIGFVVSEEILNWEPSASNDMETANTFFSHACGIPELFHEKSAFLACDGVTYYPVLPSNAYFYFFLDSEPKSITLETPEYTLSSDDRNRFAIEGYLEGEEQYASYTFTTTDGADLTGRIYYCLAEDYRQAIAQLGKNQLRQVEGSDNWLSGAFHADEDGVLLLSIPYDKGWQINLDGQTVDAVKIGDALTGIRVAQGDHSLFMRFVPPGFWLGVAFSILSAGLWMLILLKERKDYGGQKHSQKKS